jgi:WD40 repeat protein
MLAGCSTAHQRVEEWTASTSRTLPASEIAIAPPPATIDACLLGGGELVEIASVDNNDVRDHGALLTFGISEDGLLAAAGADGTLKFWTLDAELLATVDGSVIGYGSEIGAAPITDIAFSADGAVVGDVRGLVSQMMPDGAFWVLGGTTPDVPIAAVAFDLARGRVVHAQSAADVPGLVVRTVDGSSAPIEITDTLDDVRDVAFRPDGSLIVVGSLGGTAQVEIRGADPTTLVDRFGVHGSPLVEVAVARDAGTAAIIAAGHLDVLRGDALALRIPIEDAAPSSVDVAANGAVALWVGADGFLAANDTTSGASLARVAVSQPVRVRLDPTGRLAVVGSSDALLHVFTCAP